jgi:hypothetical protein
MVAARAMACASDPACSEVTATVVEYGCQYSIRKSKESITVTITATADFIEDLRKAYASLNTVEGIIWLQRQFGR